MSTDEPDLVVLGGGPGGYAAALYAASAGLRVTLVEEQRVGGTCLHRGCVPAKELLETAAVLRTVGRAGEFGVQAGPPTLDLTVAQQRKHQVVERLFKGLESLLGKRKVTVVAGRGALGEGGVVNVETADGTGPELRGRHVVLATGSVPRGLARPGLELDGRRVLSSDHVLELERVPRRVAIIGGGAIGCEFASLLSDLGSEVTVLEMLPQVLTGVDAQVAREVVRAFGKRKIDVRTEIDVVGAVSSDEEIAVRLVAGGAEERLPADAVVVSVGRRPRSEGLGFEHAGVALDGSGHVVVDANMRTSADGVFAVGDLVATPQLAHVAFAEAIVAVQTVLGEDPPPVDYDKVPWGIYCHPEVGFCGLSEERARELGHDVETSVHRFLGNSRALVVGDTDGLVKLVAAKDGPLLGVHVVGPWATELVAEGYLAVNWEATPSEVGRLVHAHPTLSELFGEAALALTGRSLHA